MKSFWNATKPFLIPCIICWTILLCITLNTQKIDLHLKINQWHSHITDLFFQYYTHVGGVAFVALVIIILLFYNYADALFVLISQIITILIIYPLKHFFAVNRPLLVFEQQNIFIHQFENFLLKDSLSFPSGHSGAAFALFLSITVLVKSSTLKFIFFILAVLVAYSRVYLSQHFTQDILAGAFIGVLAVLISYLVFYRKIKENSRLNNSLKIKC